MYATAFTTGDVWMLVIVVVILFLLAFLVEAEPLAAHLLADLFDLLKFLRRHRILDLLLQEDFPLRQLAFVNFVDLGELGFLRRCQRTGTRVGFGESLHR